MKKDIEWLKEEIRKLPSKSGVFKGDGCYHIDFYVPIKAVDDLIDKFDKSEMTLDRAFEEISKLYPMTKEEVCRHLEQFVSHGGKVTYGEQEVLLQEGNINIVLDDLKEHIKEQQSLSQNIGLAHTSSGNDTHYRQYDYVLESINEYEPSDDLQNLLVPKQELPVVPTWFDEWWKDLTKGEGNLFHNIERFHGELYGSGTKEAYNYINSPDNKKKLLNIIINELDYEVEEETLYYALIKGHELVNDEGDWSCKYWNLWVSGGCVFPADRLADYDDFLTIMSKEEWSEWGINDTNADFIKV